MFGVRHYLAVVSTLGRCLDTSFGLSILWMQFDLTSA